MSYWRAGDVADGLYEVRQVITSGGMGVVHRVRHRGWNMDLAVKTPRPEMFSSPSGMADFETEAQVWVGLGLHPNIVACVYVRRIDGLPRVFAEWVDGGTLAEAVAARRLYTGDESQALARVLDVAIQFAWGLDYAHSCGLIHQDVKPANVMLTSDWTVKVSDFGLAKARAVAGESASTATGMSVLAGYGGLTPAYCSPEQASAASLVSSQTPPVTLTRATDAWSWAISVWEMFVGEPPCRHGQAAADAFAAFRNDPSIDDPAIPAMPDSMADLLQRCLNPDPASRPRRMGELADELAGLYQRIIGVRYPRTKTEPAKLVADGLSNQALSMLDLGHADQAEQLWRQALDADPRNPSAVYNFGLQRWRTGRIGDDQLVADLHAVQAGHPDQAMTDHLLGLVHLERGDLTGARQLLAQAAAKAPDDPDIAAAVALAARLPDPPPTGVVRNTGFLTAAALSADGSRALFVGHPTAPAGSRSALDRHIFVIDFTTGRQLLSLASGGQPDDTVAFSRNGRVVLVGSWGKSASVWDVATGRQLRTLHLGHTANRVELSDDGSVALINYFVEYRPSVNQRPELWDTGSGDRVGILDHSTIQTDRSPSLRASALSGDGRVVVTGGDDGSLWVWDVATRRCLRAIAAHSGAVEAVAVSVAGRLAVSAAGDTLRTWDTQTGVCVRTMKNPTGRVTTLLLTADARTALTAVTSSSPARIWDIDAGRCIHTRPVQTPVALSGDGRIALSPISGDLLSPNHKYGAELWPTPVTGPRAPWSYARPRAAEALTSTASLVAAALDRAGQHIAASSWSAAAQVLRSARELPDHRRHPELLRLWREVGRHSRRGTLLAAWESRLLTGHTGPIESVAISGDGSVVVSASADETVKVWDSATGQCIHTLTGHSGRVCAIAVSADGHLAISGGIDTTLRIWDVATGACIHTLNGHSKHADRHGTVSIAGLALNIDGRVAISSGADGRVLVWDTASGRCLRATRDRRNGYSAVAISDDARLAVSGSRLQLWEVDTGRNLRTLIAEKSPARRRSVAFSADARVVVSWEWKGGVWDVATGNTLKTLGTSGIYGIALSADGRVAVTADSGDKPLEVWDVNTAQCLTTLTGHAGAVKPPAISRDGNYVVAGGADATVRLWELDWDYQTDSG